MPQWQAGAAKGNEILHPGMLLPCLPGHLPQDEAAAAAVVNEGRGIEVASYLFNQEATYQSSTY
eukprot:1159097-Pelagomonas_calceolata.AAC.5